MPNGVVGAVRCGDAGGEPLSARILVAEDDEMQSRLIRIYLEREGNAVQVVADGRAALDKARSTSPDLIVLDVMLPLVDGLDVCRILRTESSDIPILLLTARTTEEDMLLGLDLGADDYLTKPYSPRELTARVRALLRRSRKTGAAAQPSTLRVGEMELDTARFEVRMSGRPVALTSKEFNILETLAREPGSAGWLPFSTLSGTAVTYSAHASEAAWNFGSFFRARTLSPPKSMFPCASGSGASTPFSRRHFTNLPWAAT